MHGEGYRFISPVTSGEQKEEKPQTRAIEAETVPAGPLQAGMSSRRRLVWLAAAAAVTIAVGADLWQTSRVAALHFRDRDG